MSPYVILRILCGFDIAANTFAVESMVQLGYDREQVEQSLEMERYDEIWAAYHLLGLPVYAVSFGTADSVILLDYY